MTCTTTQCTNSRIGAPLLRCRRPRPWIRVLWSWTRAIYRSIATLWANTPSRCRQVEDNVNLSRRGALKCLINAVDSIGRDATPSGRSSVPHLTQTRKRVILRPPRAALPAFAAHFPFWYLTFRYHYVILRCVIAIVNSNATQPVSVQ